MGGPVVRWWLRPSPIMLTARPLTRSSLRIPTHPHHTKYQIMRDWNHFRQIFPETEPFIARPKYRFPTCRGSGSNPTHAREDLAGFRDLGLGVHRGGRRDRRGRGNCRNIASGERLAKSMYVVVVLVTPTFLVILISMIM